MVRAIRISSMAFASGMARGSRWVPPAPGMMAQRTSGSPNVAWGTAMRRSHARASSMPPARQWPLMAAIMGFQISSPRVIPPSPRSLWLRRRPSPNAAGIICLRSAPAEKAFSPAPVKMATHALSSSRKRVHASISA
jgi:hypothetical protein